VQLETEVVNLNFDKVSDNAQMYGRNATIDITMYLFFVSPRRVSSHRGTDVSRFA
jgi:hypothetical protein